MSRGNSFVNNDNDGFKIFRPNDFSEYIIPKINMIKSIQQKRENFN